MRHYHGTPLGGSQDCVARFVATANRNFLIPFSNSCDLPIVAERSSGFCFDNGAFSAWKKGKPIDDWKPYYNWCKEWCRNPRFDFAIIPDVIDGDEFENKRLFGEWFRHCKFPNNDGWVEGAPVWHMHESFDYLRFLMSHSKYVCIGSSGQYATPGTSDWHERMAKAMDVLCDDQGRPRRKIHGLRMLDPRIVERYPFHSADSTNVAINSMRVTRYGIYAPPTRAQRKEVLAARIEATISPSVWIPQPEEVQSILNLQS